MRIAPLLGFATLLVAAPAAAQSGDEAAARALMQCSGVAIGAVAVSRVVTARQLSDDWTVEVYEITPDLGVTQLALQLRAMDAAGCDAPVVDVADLSVDLMVEFAQPVLDAHRADDVAAIRSLWETYASQLDCASALDADDLARARHMIETNAEPVCGYQP